MTVKQDEKAHQPGDPGLVSYREPSVYVSVAVLASFRRLQSLDSPRCCEVVNTCGYTVPVKVSRITVKIDFSPFAPRTLPFGLEHAQG